MKRNLVEALALLAVITAAGCSSGFGVTDVKRITQGENPSAEVPKFTCLANSATMRLPEQFRAYGLHYEVTLFIPGTPAEPK